MKQEFLKTKEDITAWLDKYKIKKYTLKPDEKYGCVVDVVGNVKLMALQLTFIPVKFSSVSGSFNCSKNELTSLEFSPTTVGLDFCCNGNQLTSLEFGPEVVGHSFVCAYNQLTSLEYCPKTVVFNFVAYNNQLKTLEFCPESVGGEFYCTENPELGYIQEICDFSQILNIHKEFLNIKKEKSLLDDLIAPVATQNSESFKI